MVSHGQRQTVEDAGYFLDGPLKGKLLAVLNRERVDAVLPVEWGFYERVPEVVVSYRPVGVAPNGVLIFALSN